MSFFLLAVVGNWSKNIVSHSCYSTAQSLWPWLALLLPSHNSLSLCFIPAVSGDSGSHKSALTLTTSGVHGGRNGMPFFLLGVNCPFQLAIKTFLALLWPFHRAWPSLEFGLFFPMPLKTACARHCWLHIIKCDIIHSVICVPIVGSHFGCPKCQLEGP